MNLETVFYCYICYIISNLDYYSVLLVINHFVRLLSQQVNK